MLRQFLVGGGVTIINIAIHAWVMAVVVQVARSSRRSMLSPSLFLMAVMIQTMLVLVAAHLVEVFIWSAAYFIVDATPSGTDLVYFAFVNYTTLGYGDVVPLPEWRLLGPITAMNGMLLFGWSTAVIFEVLRKALEIKGKIPRT